MTAPKSAHEPDFHTFANPSLGFVGKFVCEHACMRACVRGHALNLLGFAEQVLWPRPEPWLFSSQRQRQRSTDTSLWPHSSPLGQSGSTLNPSHPPSPPLPSPFLPNSFLQMHRFFAHLPHPRLLISRHLRGLFHLLPFV